MEKKAEKCHKAYIAFTLKEKDFIVLILLD